MYVKKEIILHTYNHSIDYDHLKNIFLEKNNIKFFKEK